MECRNCGSICSDDYMMMDIIRIKDGELLVPFKDNGSKVIFCMNCADKVVKVINDFLKG